MNHFAPDDATRAQIDAAAPGRSTWLSANAGSGKTRVLTDRVARLLLEGTSPQNILCLTYTKAAASEMQNRLFKRLGQWAMLPDADLRDALGQLGVAGAITAPRLALARTLFARAIETPGGLKIQTIHSFCASLLRRFPLEAGVSPQFTEMDERAARLLMAEIVEEMADTLAPDTVDALARHYTGEDFSDLTAEIARHRDRFFPPRSGAALFAAFGLDPATTEADILAQVFLGTERDLVAKLLPALAAGSKTDAKAAEKLSLFKADPPTLADLALLEDVLLTGASAASPFSAKTGKFPTKATQQAIAHLLPHLEALMLRVEHTRPRRTGLAAARRSVALHAFATAFLPLYEARKLARGWLDFEDLILKARALMTDSAVAQWVLFRLDGGVDHILVDEAQDTSPAQWQVVELLAQEFAAGDGRRGAAERSLFVVGDLKQSIYSFQGADPQSFLRMFAHFDARMADTAPLQRLELRHSFRSSAAILAAVDAVFGGTAEAPLDLAASHIAFHQTLPGRVDLWPVLPEEDTPDDAPWYDPVDRVSPGAADVELARRIAAEIRAMIERKETIPAEKGTRRPLHEGDILILVQRRNRLFNELIRACKQQGLRIAGADRLQLGAEMAVKDLRALLAFLALPMDDLSLACALRSPLFGVTEAQLYDLSQGRGDATLWDRLRHGPHPGIAATLTDLRDQVDYLRPYDLLERILLRHDGRARLLARLGTEAQDGIDELLNQALAFERMEVPSLTGFLAWLEAGDVEVKRQAESAGDRIRVMSVHGAKGLEAPVVILPDTLRKKSDIRQQLFPSPETGILWRTAADEAPPLVEAAKAALTDADARERGRLLYVAMTRAETWLIVCGAGKDPKDTWYSQIADAFATLPTTPLTCPTGEGLRLQHGDWMAGDLTDPRRRATDPSPLPGWIASHVAAPPLPPKVLTPSGLGGAKALPGEGFGLTEDEAKTRGTRLHLLLEVLPNHPEADWPALAATLIGDIEAAGLLPEAARVLKSPDLAFLFAPEALAEVDIAALMPGQTAQLQGTIDRLLVLDDRVLAVDFKSNATVPPAPAAVPEGILAQLGSYAAGLQAIFPGKRIETAVLWTATATFMPLPDDIVRTAFARATSS
ncbi:double-strand break repair helicase AddA [Oceaniglobus roseus]|uniref:double-strand break repair helicase AddA n=1 Tax=Oceaniglobus roseus TaxID=1737570 RepID=UPI001FE5CB8C|nr:double-strand break repair helicase AddA [Kandeliimicrobium roseum]